MWNPNPFFGGYQQPQQYQQPVRAQVPQVNGEGGAKAYSLAPIFLLCHFIAPFRRFMI